MFTTKSFRHLLWGALVLGASHAQGQATVPGNSGIFSDFLGWNSTATNNFSLQVRHDLDYPIDFYTTGRFRARINPVRTLSINGFMNVPTTGFMLISPDFTFLTVRKTPYSRLHLAEGVEANASPWGYRDWQRNGITFTGNDDHGYIGHKYGEPDVTDMVIQWSDNPGFSRADRMRFIFTSEFLPGPLTGMNSLEGLEGMRLWPADDRNVNVGVGDFFAYGSDPTERLHMINGRLRIESLPTDPEALGLTKVMMVDDAAGGEHGVVKWLDVANLIPNDCEWTMNATAPNHVFTAVGAVDPNCPDAAEAVGIGVDPGTIVFPQVVAKLNVVTDQFTEGQRIVVSTASANLIGGFFDVSGATNHNIGLQTNLNGTNLRNTGIFTDSNGATFSAWGGAFNSHDNASYTFGAQGTVYAGTITSKGLVGWTPSDAATNIGVEGHSFALTAGINKVFRGVSGSASLMDPS